LAVTKRNLTVQLDEEVVRRAKVLAARQGTSVSNMVAVQIERLVSDEERYEEARRRAQQALENAVHRGGRRWRREELHEQ